MKHLALLVICLIVSFFMVGQSIDDPKYPLINKNLLLAFVSIAVMCFVIIELLVWAIKTLAN